MASKRRLRRVAARQPAQPGHDPYAADAERELRLLALEESRADPELDEMRREWREREWYEWYEKTQPR